MTERDDSRIAIGQRLPLREIDVSAQRVVAGAAASFDWQPQHHDHCFAVERMKLPGIILNQPTQTGWLAQLALAWSGYEARIARQRVRMRSPISPGDRMQFGGEVVACERAAQGWHWLQLALTLHCGERLATDCALLLALPVADGMSPWQVAAADWQPPPWLIE